jgi:hypothetical protein
MDLCLVEEFTETVLCSRETNGSGVGTNDEIGPEVVRVETVPRIEQQYFAVIIGKRRQRCANALVCNNVILSR